MNKIKNSFRIMFLFTIGFISFYNGSRKTRKWVLKNEKEQDQNLYDFDKRWNYSKKKVKKFVKRLGVEVVLEGEQHLPKGGCWIVTNHVSNFDGLYLINALGYRFPISSVVKEITKKNRFVRGYFLSSNSFFLDRGSLRNSVDVMNGAANYAKQNNTAMVVFPEGTRNLQNKIQPFKCGSFKFPVKYGLPIVSITILGAMEARRFWSLKKRKVIIKVHKQLKTIDYIKLKNDIICKITHEKIHKDIIEYEKNLSDKQIKDYAKMQKKSLNKENKKNKNLKKEIQKSHSSK